MTRSRTQHGGRSVLRLLVVQRSQFHAMGSTESISVARPACQMRAFLNFASAHPKFKSKELKTAQCLKREGEGEISGGRERQLVRGREREQEREKVREWGREREGKRKRERKREGGGEGRERDR